MSAPEPLPSAETSLHLESARMILQKVRQSFSSLKSGGELPDSILHLAPAGMPVRILFRDPQFQKLFLPALRPQVPEKISEGSFSICLAGPETLGGGWASAFRPQSSTPQSAESFFSVTPDEASMIFVTEGFSCVSFLDRKTGEAIYALSDPRQMPSYEAAAPLRVLLYWKLAERGLQAVHAAAVGTQAGAVMIAGRGGSGKSNTALACLSAGLSFCGDDYVIVDSAPQEPLVYSFFASAKLYPRDLVHHPDFDRWFAAVPVREDASEKRAYVLKESGLERVLPQAPVKAVVLPQFISEQESRAEPVDRGAALKELAPSTLFQFPGAGQADFQRIAALVRKVPCYRLSLGRRSRSYTDLLRSLCEGRAGALS